MIKGTTQTGFKFSAQDDVLDNMELVDALAELDEGQTLAISRVCKCLLGETQRKDLYDHIRSEDGRVPMASIEAELMDIIQFLNKGKKSSPSPT